MAEEKKNPSVDSEETPVKENKKAKPVEKKPNFFSKMKKFAKDVAGEMKKVVWTSKTDLKKNTKLVLVTVVCVSLAIVLVDTAFSYLINFVAGLVG